MKIKKAGFWREEGYSKMPSIFEQINNHQRTKIPWRLFFYLYNSPVISISMSGTTSVIDGKPIHSDRLHTDGKWVWSSTLIYYYQEHGLKLSEEFQKHIQRRIIPYPIFFSIRNLLTNGRLVSNVLKVCMNDEQLTSQEI